jgi:hypothetical protein
MKYRKKPVTVEAVQFLGWVDNDTDAVKNIWPAEWSEAVKTWRRFRRFRSTSCTDDKTGTGLDELLVPTLEGVMAASPGDWIIRGVAGEFYPCKPDIFAATYEPDDGMSELERLRAENARLRAELDEERRHANTLAVDNAHIVEQNGRLVAELQQHRSAYAVDRACFAGLEQQNARQVAWTALVEPIIAALERAIKNACNWK